MAKGDRAQSDTPGRSPWPLSAWAPIPSRFVLCTEGRFFPAGFMRRVARTVGHAVRAPLPVLHERIRSREAGDPEWFLSAATYTAEVFERAQVEDHLVDNENRPATAVAEEVLHRVGWLPPGAAGQ